MNQNENSLSYITVAPINAPDLIESNPTKDVYWIISTIGNPRVYACFYNLEDAREYLTKVKGQQPWEIAVHTRSSEENE